MTRYAKKVDANHATIRDGLRTVGYTVDDLSGYGNGIPDLAVRIFPGIPHFLEIKDGSKPKSKQSLTSEQEEWHQLAWQLTSKVTSLREAIEALDNASFRFSYLDIR